MPYKVDFKQLATDIDIGDVAKHLGLKLTKDRAHCPVCDSDRAIQLFEETNTFRCHSAGVSGDCIHLYAHIKGTGMYKSALALSELFASASVPRTGTHPETHPQKPEGPLKPPPSASTVAAPVQKKGPEPFDAQTFGEKLEYTNEVAELELSEDMAKLHRIGVHRGKLYVPICPPDVTPLAYAEYKDGKLRVPTKWLDKGNVVRLKRA
jgi:hypothetical protein